MPALQDSKLYKLSRILLLENIARNTERKEYREATNYYIDSYDSQNSFPLDKLDNTVVYIILENEAGMITVNRYYDPDSLTRTDNIDIDAFYDSVADLHENEDLSHILSFFKTAILHTTDVIKKSADKFVPVANNINAIKAAVVLFSLLAILANNPKEIRLYVKYEPVSTNRKSGEIMVLDFVERS